MKNRFVIVTNRRSGSNMLVSMLDNHPEIKCFGELMRRTPRWMKRKGYRGALRVLEKVDAIYKSDRYRFDHPYEFVQAAFETAPRRKTLSGFKLHLGQNQSFLFRLIQNPDWKLVVLERENKLAQYSSSKIARVTGQGSLRKGAKVVRVTVPFSVLKLKWFLRRERKEWERVYSKLGTSGKDYFYIRYTDLLSKPVIQNMLEYLGADPSIEIEPMTEKRNPSDILSRFLNPEKSKAVLLKMGCEGWCKEVFKSRDGKMPDTVLDK